MFRALCVVLVMVASSSKPTVAVEDRPHPSLISPHQGKACCINCGEFWNDHLTSGVWNPAEMGFQDLLSFSFWARKESTGITGDWPLLNLYHYDDINYFQLFKSTQGDYIVGTGFPSSYIQSQQPHLSTWKHYAVAWNVTSGNLSTYVNGDLAANHEASSPSFFSPEGIILVLAQYGEGYSAKLDKLVMNKENRHKCMFDELRVYNRLLDPAEVAQLADQNNAAAFGTSNITKEDASLILHYTFDEVVNPVTEEAKRAFSVQNHGSAGDEYNLKPNLGNADFSFQSLHGSCSVDLEVQIPLFFGPAVNRLLEPPIAQNTTVKLREDSAVTFHLYSEGFGFTTDPSGLEAVVTRLPEKGKLFMMNYGDDGTTKVRGRVVDSVPVSLHPDDKSTVYGMLLFVPDTDGSGKSYTSFDYKLINDDGVESSPGTITFDIARSDDIATLESFGMFLDEDSSSKNGRVPVLLKHSDAESDPLSIIITELPSKGTLYHTLSGDDKIVQAYEKSRHIVPVEQYVWEVNAVSSFWGGPPYTGYHALNIIGRPSCATVFDQECSDQRKMFVTVEDGTFRYPLSSADIGELVRAPRPGGFATSLGKIVAVYPEEGRVNVSLVVMRKTVNGVIVDCVFGKTGNTYPKDCDPAIASLLPTDPSTGKKVDIITVDRKDLVTLPAGVWCPLQIGYVGDKTMEGGDIAGAYGDQYRYTFNQAETYDNSNVYPPYTEFIEVEFKEKVYPWGMHIGCPRGCYSVVAIKAKYTDEMGVSTWVTVYKGEADKARWDKQFESKVYSHFDVPKFCNQAFASKNYRIEVDTSTETGIPSWNYIDYFKLIGDKGIQSGVLQYPKDTLYYEPWQHANGEDAFEYVVTDCLGDSFRESETGIVSIHIKPVNDPPILNEKYAQGSTITIHVDDENGTVREIHPFDILVTDIFLNVDKDNNDVLTYKISQGDAMIDGGELLKFACPMVQEKDGKHMVTVTATDSAGLSADCKLTFVCVYADRNRLDGGIISFGYALAILNIVVSLICIAWTIQNGHVQIVKYAQRHFLIMIAIGCILSSSSIFFLSIEDAEDGDTDQARTADLGCQLLPWTYSIGFVTTFTSLFAKLRKVHLVHTASKQFVHIKVSVGKVLSWILGFLAIDAVILLLWTINDPLVYRRSILTEDSDGYATETAGLCSSEKGNSFTYFGIIMGLHFLLLVYGNYIAYMCRNLSGAFAETKYISIAMVSNIQVLLLGIPVVLIVQDDVVPNYFVRVGVIFLNDFTVLALIFFPKIMHVSLGMNILPTNGTMTSHSSTVGSDTGGTKFTEPSSIKSST